MKNKLGLASLLVCTAALWAQDPNQAPYPDPNQSPAQDPPSRVARLNLLQGQVSFQPATVTDWTAATLNYPVTIGDHLYADADSRAEMQIGSTAVRLGSTSAMSFLNLDDRLVQIRLDQGALIVRVRELGPDDAYEIDTAQGAVTLLRAGEYRIDTDPDRNATMVTVRSGDASVNTNGGGFPVHPHQTAYFANDGQPQFDSENPADSLDQFSTDQDRQVDTLPPPRYVSQDMPGWQDLERNGVWTEEPDYGPVWRPRTVDAGWAPYRYGHWAWVDPWGWTWIDDAPWGFAPFHYGRWVMAGGAWVWVPGPLDRHPVYAPALVAFVGGRNFSLAVGVGGGMGAVAWFPLGPREVFVPAYRVSPLYVNRVNVTRVNITNVTVVNRTYINRSAGYTAVDQRAFVGAQPVHRAMIGVPRDVVARSEVSAAAPVAPQRSSVMGRAGGGMNVPRPGARVIERPVYAQRTPPPAPVPFAARQQALEQNPGRPVDPQTINRLRGNSQGRESSVRTLPSRPANQGGNAGGNSQGSQFGRPGNRSFDRSTSQPAVNSNGQGPASPVNRQRYPDGAQAPANTQSPRPRFEQPGPATAPPATTPADTAQQERRQRNRPDVNSPAPAPAPVPAPAAPRDSQMQQERRQRQRPEAAAPSQPAQAAPAARPAAREERQAPRHEDRPAPKRENRREDKKEEK